MTDFERKRLEFFIQAAEKGDWVKLGKGDIELFKKYTEMKKMWVDITNNQIEIQRLQEQMGIPLIPINIDNLY